MKRTVLIAAILLLLIVSVVSANQVAVGQVEDENVSMITVPVYHDTTGRTEADLTTREKHFLSQVPAVVGSKTGRTLRDACREMLLANVIHVPALPCGNWTRNDSVRYWSIYQAWTGPAKAKVPVIRGPAGANGANGADSTVPGPRGPRGFKGDVGTGVTNNYFTSAPVMCSQIGGQSPYLSNSIQLASVSMYQMANTNISVSATGGAGGSSNVVNNNANTNVNTNANNNAINVGDGTASGTATGTGTGTSTAGSGNP